MNLAKTRDPIVVNRLRAALCQEVCIRCNQVAVYIRGPGKYLAVAEVTTEAEAKKIVEDCNKKRPVRGYRAFVRPLRFELAD
jgi:hypothetical protein